MSKPKLVAPHDIDAERGIIGAILTPDGGAEALQKVIDSYLNVDHFYSGKHQIIFFSILNLHETSKAVDLITTTEQLMINYPDFERKFNLDPAVYMDECIDSCPTPKNVLYYVEIVKDKARRRLFLRQAVKVQNLMISVDQEFTDVDQTFIELKDVVSNLETEAEEIKPFEKQEVFKVFSSWELQELKIERKEYIVDDWLPLGTVNLLAGKGKIGKSWMVLGLGIAGALGGKWLNMDVKKGSVLYLALEDDPGRMKDRLSKLYLDEVPEGLFTCFDIPVSGAGGIKHLNQWIKTNENAKLVIIDTFQKFRDKINARANIYMEDYNAITPLKALAKAYNVCILLVHHLRKSIAYDGDPLDCISGSTGLSGAVDNAFVLKRERTNIDAVLFKTGRDIKEDELALNFDPSFGLWKVLGDADEYRMSKERQEIIRILKNSTESLTPKEIAEALDRTSVSIRKMLFTLKNEGLVYTNEYGRYKAK